MKPLRIRSLAAAVLACCILPLGCSKKNNAVVIHVFLDPAAPGAAQLVRAIDHFHSLNIRGKNGRSIVVAAADSTEYAGSLQNLGRGLNPELVFLNSRSDAEKNLIIRAELSRAIELGGEGRRCVVFIPSWVEGDELVATQTFLNFLISSGDLW